MSVLLQFDEQEGQLAIGSVDQEIYTRVNDRKMYRFGSIAISKSVAQ